MTAKQSEERPENVNTGNWRQLVRDVVDENPGVFIPNDKPTAMNTQSPPTTLSEERLRHIEPLVHETFNSELGDTGDYEGHSVIRTENGGTWYSDTINPDDDHIEDHAEIVRRVNAFPSLLHAAEQMARHQWQPIESAPRDGARFLATKRWRNGEWQYFECCYVETIAGPKWHDLSSNDWSKPTHWMPLPQPPTKGGES